MLIEEERLQQERKNELKQHKDKIIRMKAKFRLEKSSFKVNSLYALQVKYCLEKINAFEYQITKEKMEVK